MLCLIVFICSPFLLVVRVLGMRVRRSVGGPPVFTTTTTTTTTITTTTTNNSNDNDNDNDMGEPPRASPARPVRRAAPAAAGRGAPW